MEQEREDKGEFGDSRDSIPTLGTHPMTAQKEKKSRREGAV